MRTPFPNAPVYFEILGLFCFINTPRRVELKGLNAHISVYFSSDFCCGNVRTRKK